MKRVPPELESLMWTLAEEGNDRAIDEFGERHPELRTELLHRISMVKGLRGAKKKVEEPVKAIPKFVPRETKPSSPFYIVGGLVLAALCALAFAVTILLTPAPHRAPEPTVPINKAPIQPPVQPTNQAPVTSQSLPPPVEAANQPQKEDEKDLKPGTLRIEHAPLLTVLDMMSDVCHIRIDPAPGMPNPDVVVDYRDMNAMEMLRDLGRQYRFTPIDQHDGSILVVPAIEMKEGGSPSAPVGNYGNRKLGG